MFRATLPSWPLSLRATTSLLVVDAQSGFTELCPEELPVPGGLAIVPAVNAAARPSRSPASTPRRTGTRPITARFLGQRDNLYPPHCVIGTPGAEFLPGLAHAPLLDHLAQGLRPRLRGLRGHGPAPRIRRVPEGERHHVGGRVRHRDEHLLLLRRPRPAPAGFDVLMVEDASAGIDVPAAGLFQAKARADGEALGIRYRDHRVEDGSSAVTVDARRIDA